VGEEAIEAKPVFTAESQRTQRWHHLSFSVERTEKEMNVYFSQAPV
jgi:hypothetical protein